MSNLAQIQDAFAEALRGASRIPPDEVRNPSGRSAQRRFGVYRNNVAAGLIAALGMRFPVVMKLVGEEFFREMARQYVALEPPHSPIMLLYGDTFPGFIEGFAPAAPVPYLAAIARLEMARGMAYHAADAVPLGAEAFAALPANDLAGMTAVLHPSMSVVESGYPIHSIWMVNQPDAAVVPISPWAPETALVARPYTSVEVRKLQPGEGIFLTELARGATFASAVEAATKTAERFDMVRSLKLLIDAGLVVRFGSNLNIARAH